MKVLLYKHYWTVGQRVRVHPENCGLYAGVGGVVVGQELAEVAVWVLLDGSAGGPVPFLERELLRVEE